jgi:hypothetical protein
VHHRIPRLRREWRHLELCGSHTAGGNRDLVWAALQGSTSLQSKIRLPIGRPNFYSNFFTLISTYEIGEKKKHILALSDFFTFLFFTFRQCGTNQGFFCSILWCSQTGHHPWEDLAKFGYRPNMEVKKFKNPSTIWLFAGICFRILRFQIWWITKILSMYYKTYFGHIPKIEKMQKFTPNFFLPLPMWGAH